MPIDNLTKLKYFNVDFPAEYVAHVEINRPEKLNAFFDPMWYELRDVFDFLTHQPDVRVILLSGAGDKAFTAGLDVVATGESSPVLSNEFPDAARKASRLRRYILELQDTVSSVARCEKPVIALVHGIAYGLGVDLSSACDIRLCSSDAKFCVKEVDVGLAADVGTLSRIAKVCGGLTSFVKEACYAARPFDAEEAEKNHFVSKVVKGGKKELVEEGLRMAQLIASKSPVAVQGTKNILDASWGRTVEDNLVYTAAWNAAMLQTADIPAALMAALKKQKPTFEKL